MAGGFKKDMFHNKIFHKDLFKFKRIASSWWINHPDLVSGGFVMSDDAIEKIFNKKYRNRILDANVDRIRILEILLKSKVF